MAESSASSASKSATNAKTSENNAKGYAESAETAIEEIAKSVEQFEQDAESIRGAVAEFTTSVEEAKEELNDYVEQAAQSAEQANIALNNGCVYEVREIGEASLTVDKTITIYKHTPTEATEYSFATPTDAVGKVCVFWLWVVMGETAHVLTFPPSVEWLTEPSLGANTETLLALMSVDGGATWTANVQWEKAVA